MTPDTLKIAELIASKIVELFYIGLLAYVAKLTSAYLTRRLEVLGPDARIFVSRKDTDPESNRINPFESSTYEKSL